MTRHKGRNGTGTRARTGQETTTSHATHVHILCIISSSSAWLSGLTWTSSVSYLVTYSPMITSEQARTSWESQYTPIRQMISPDVIYETIPSQPFILNFTNMTNNTVWSPDHTYFPIQYTDSHGFGPAISGSTFMGIDIGAYYIHRLAMRTAIDTNQPILSEPISFTYGSGSRIGATIFMPVYQNCTPQAIYPTTTLGTTSTVTNTTGNVTCTTTSILSHPSTSICDSVSHRRQAVSGMMSLTFLFPALFTRSVDRRNRYIVNADGTQSPFSLSGVQPGELCVSVTRHATESPRSLWNQYVSYFNTTNTTTNMIPLTPQIQNTTNSTWLDESLNPVNVFRGCVASSSTGPYSGTGTGTGNGSGTVITSSNCSATTTNIPLSEPYTVCDACTSNADPNFRILLSDRIISSSYYIDCMASKHLVSRISTYRPIAVAIGFHVSFIRFMPCVMVVII